MPGDTDDPIAPSPGLVTGLRYPLPVSIPAGTEPVEPVSVTVVGADARARQRVMDALAGTPGVRVVGWAESVQALGLLDHSPQVLLPVELEGAGRPADDGSAARGGLPRPELSARQREVLVAYTSSNELLEVVARGLGMGAETLKTHLRRIRAKYETVGRHAPTRRDLYARAIEDGLVPPPG